MMLLTVMQTQQAIGHKWSEIAKMSYDEIFSFPLINFGHAEFVPN